MRPTSASLEAQNRADQLHQLGGLLEQALLESHQLHHRIREIQLRVAELSAGEEKGRPVAVVSATTLQSPQLSPR